MTRHRAFLCLVFFLVAVSVLWFVSFGNTEWGRYAPPPTIEQMMLAEEKEVVAVKLPKEEEEESRHGVVYDSLPSAPAAEEKEADELPKDDDVMKEDNLFHDSLQSTPVSFTNHQNTTSTTKAPKKTPETSKEDHHLVCDTAPDDAKPLQPILMIANARTGSNLFFSFLENLAAKQDDVDLLPLYEVFGTDQILIASVVSRIIDQIWRGCQWDKTEEVWYTNRTQFASPEQVFTAALGEMTTTVSQKQQVLLEFQQVFDQRFNHPAPFLQFLHRIPSSTQYPIFALKVFPYHVMDLLNLNIADFISLFSQTMENAQYVILWRRNLLEIFVSFHIADRRNAWVNVGSTHEDAILVTQSELEWFVQRTTDFYHQARDCLESQSIPYEVFEYDHDLSNATQQQDTVQRIQTTLLHQELWNEELARTIVGKPGTAKQATVPLSQQIVNWNDVQQWGYSESSEDWPDLFS